ASPALGGVLAGFVVAAALGLRFVFAERAAGAAMALRRGQRIAAGERVLIVEDVVTTGGSAREVSALCRDAGATVVGVVALVDRSKDLPAAERPNPAPRALATFSPQTWTPEDCPFCAKGTPLDSPGSRKLAR
ncbi:MAG: orotate phosphoribosyltransferase, partial [Actinomycetota bacterium]|nr:orotate phosphoribosyltransferase [Actinomycetota bacterium]